MMMPMTRDPNLQILLDKAKAAIAARATPPMAAAAGRVFERLNASVGLAAEIPTAERLPVCRHLDAIYSGMEGGASPLPEIASAFMTLETRLDWQRRRTSTLTDQPFHDRHANATLIGPGGLEQREDLWVGVTVMAPGVTYPDHSHPPEEVYLAFTEGEWWNAEMDWTSPGPGGLIYNPPGILHAMRSGEKPFLALWILPVD